MQILWSGIGMVAGSGKLGGTVMSKNKSGAIARVRVKPNDPQTQKQIKHRREVGYWVNLWQHMQEERRVQWNRAAESGEWSLKNSLGYTFNPTGAQLFTHLNLNLVTIGEPNIFDVPSKEGQIQGVGVAYFLVGQADATEWAYEWGFSDPLPTTWKYVLRISAGMSPGRFSSPRIPIISVKSGGGTSVGESYGSTTISIPTVGQKYFSEVTAINRTTGQSYLLAKESSLCFLF